MDTIRPLANAGSLRNRIALPVSVSADMPRKKGTRVHAVLRLRGPKPNLTSTQAKMCHRLQLRTASQAQWSLLSVQPDEPEVVPNSGKPLSDMPLLVNSYVLFAGFRLVPHTEPAGGDLRKTHP